MAGEFVALADVLRAPAAARDAGACDDDLSLVPPDSVASAAAAGDAVAHCVVHADVAGAVREARLFRARLADAFDDAAARLVRELATDVLARELRLAPCDLAAIVRRIGERAPVVRVRVAARDAAALAAAQRSGGCDVVIVADPALAGGDAIVELAGGALDARLGVRLAVVLEAFA